MQKWEYLIIKSAAGEISLYPMSRTYVLDDFFVSIDPRGKKSKDGTAWLNKIDDFEFLSLLMNKLGADGWELISYEDISFFFKRPMRE